MDKKDRSVINHEEKTLQAELGKVKTVYDVKEHQSRINKEKESEIEKLGGKAVFKLKETDNLKEIQEKTKVKRSKQLERAKDSKRQLESREDEVEENSLEEENFKLREHISELKESVSDLEKKLSEEEFISKRLGMEVRSLEAQLVYADRQLRQKLANEEARQKYNEGKDSNSRNVSTTQSFVSTDSVVSESNLVEFSGEQKAPDNENENEKRVEDSESSPDHLEVKGGLRRRSALYQMKDDNRTGSREKRRSTVGGTFFVVDHFTTQDEPAEFDYDYDWDRILELQRRNAACLPHMRSSYPVETQVHTEQEVREEELKSGHSTSYISRKRVRDNASDTNINVTFQIPYDEQTYHTQTLHISKSDKGVVLDDRTKSKRMVSKYSSIKSTNKDENRPLFTSGSFIEQPTRSYNSERFARRENITFNVDLSPPKKARSTFQRSIHRSFGKSDLSINEGKEAVRNKTTGKLQGVRKFPLPRRPIVLKSDKKPLAPKNTNIA